MSETSTSQDPVSYYIDHTIYTGRPADTTSRLPKEIRTYDLLDSLGKSSKQPLSPSRSAAPAFPLPNRNLWNSTLTSLPVLSVFSV